MNQIARLATALSLVAIIPAVVQAQSTNGVHFNIAAGASLPTGDLGNVVDVGYALAVGIGVRQPASPLGFRVEGSYNEWSFSDNVFRGAKTHVGGVSANATYDFMAPGTTRRGTSSGNTLYGIGGLGVFGTGNGGSNLGWNIGGGFKFPLSGFSAYFEARYHNVSSGDFSFVPITFGLEF